MRGYLFSEIYLIDVMNKSFTNSTLPDGVPINLVCKESWSQLDFLGAAQVVTEF